MFALAAPIGAIITYLILNTVTKLILIILKRITFKKNLIKKPEKHGYVTSSSTGLCMLFSAGTFLYVSTVHVLPEVQNHDKQLTFIEVLTMIFGSVLPLVLSIGHSH